MNMNRNGQNKRDDKKESIMVSFCIPTYNQAQYIAEAIEGCLKQVTHFSYEILVRDDYSNDGTRDIIMDYQKKYPGLVYGIFEKENLYSKGVKIFPAFKDVAHGKYIALNEGDDFWTDSEKIEKQVMFLENHPDYSLTVHAANIVNDRHNVIGKICPEKEERDFSTDELILGGGEMLATNSMLFRSKYIHSLPPFYYDSYVEDYPLVVYLSTQGKVHYFPEVMSAYRQAAQGSWTRKKNTGDVIKNQLSSCDKILSLLEDMKKYYNPRYAVSFENRIAHFTMNKFILSGDLKAMKKKYPEKFSKMTSTEKAIMAFKHYCPSGYNWLKTRLDK